MHTFKHLFTLYKKLSRNQPRTNALEVSPLRQLPVELILNIVQSLDPASAASFSLCSRRIYFMIGGARYLEALQRGDLESELRAFLTLLEPHLPDHVLCYFCKKFHSMKTPVRHIWPPINTYSNPCRKCWYALGYCFAATIISPSFSWTLFQMTMKRYRQGLNHFKFLRFLSYQRLRSYGGRIHEFTLLPRVVDGSLLVRTQEIFLPFRPDNGFIVCPHTLRVYPKPGTAAGEYLQHRMAHWDDKPPESHEAGLTRCAFCRTEGRLDFKELEGLGVAMVFTKWQELGRGLSPFDSEWSSHVYSFEGTWGKLRKPVDFEKGSISNTFEQGKAFDFSSRLTASWRKAWVRRSRWWGDFDTARYLSGNEVQSRE